MVGEGGVGGERKGEGKGWMDEINEKKVKKRGSEQGVGSKKVQGGG